MRTPARPAATALALRGRRADRGLRQRGTGRASPAAEAPPAGAPFLATSMATAAGTWAVAVMGGSVASHNNFWQLFVRPAGSTQLEAGHPARHRRQRRPGPGRRRPVTDHRVPAQPVPHLHAADRDRATAAGPGRRPARSTRRSPTSPTRWPPHRAPGSCSPCSPAAPPRLAAPGYTSWTTLATRAPSPPRRQAGDAACRPSPPPPTPRREPLLAGTAPGPGTAGIFAGTGGTWQATGPPMPAALARQPVTVLRLDRPPARSSRCWGRHGPAASLLAAWSADNGRHWTLSPALPLGGQAVASASFGPGGTAAVITTAGHAD